MASVNITVDVGNKHYSIDLEAAETNGQVWGGDTTTADRILDEAVTRLKRAYSNPQEPQ